MDCSNLGSTAREQVIYRMIDHSTNDRTQVLLAFRCGGSVTFGGEQVLDARQNAPFGPDNRKEFVKTQ